MPDAWLPIPDWLQPALDAALHDLQRPIAVPLAFGWTEPAHADEPGYLWVQETPADGYGGSGLPIHQHAYHPAELVCHVADQLQEQVFPETGAAWGEARPACPGHTHPAVPRVRNGPAWWVCPVSRAALWPIGQAP